MAKTTNRNATDWDLKWCSLTNRNKTKTDLRDLLISFKYYEDLDRLNPLAEIMFGDGKNPISVGENDVIDIQVCTTAHTDDEIVYLKFNIEEIKTTKLKEGGKVYDCRLITEESSVITKFKNKKSYRGNGFEILNQMFKDSEYGVAIHNDGNLPFNPLVIESKGKKIPQLVKDVCTQSIPASGKTMNTCGYFCWGTKKGEYDQVRHRVEFKSIDSLLSVGGTHKGADSEYTYYQASQAASLTIPAQLIIHDVKDISRGNIKKLADDGVFLADALVLNEDTRQYMNKEWDIRKWWDRWGHIATRKGQPPWNNNAFLKDLMSKGEASKTFNLHISHEKFHNKASQAAPDKDSDSLEPEGKYQSTDFQDWDEETIVQYNARRATMTLSISDLVVPGNQYLHAGDKIKLYLRASLPDAKTTIDGYDKELSGDYLIYSVTQWFSMAPKKECWTSCTLVRDTINKNC